MKSLDQGVDLIVATPGRLDDLVSQPDRFTGRDILSLSMVHYVVLDEADCMLELGFEHQVRRLLGKVNAKHQILCFSATWPPKVELLAKERVKNAIRIEVGANQATGISGNSNCEQHVRCLRQSTAEAKTRELIRLLRLHKEACIVFCATKKRTAQLGRELREASFAVRALHGDLPQADRQQALAAFRNGEARILVATDVAARGLDIKSLSYVVSFDPAASLDGHVHRIGRCGRGASRGRAFAFLGPEDVTYAQLLCESMKSSGQAVPNDVAAIAAKPCNASEKVRDRKSVV